MNHVVDYLNRGRAQEAIVQALYERIAALDAHVEACTRIYGISPHGDSPNPDRRYDAVAKLLDAKRELLQEIDQLCATQREIAAVISQVQDERLRAVLEYRYIACSAWERIARKMHYSVRNIYILHTAALHAVEPFIPQEEKEHG